MPASNCIELKQNRQGPGGDRDLWAKCFTAHRSTFLRFNTYSIHIPIIHSIYIHLHAFARFTTFTIFHNSNDILCCSSVRRCAIFGYTSMTALLSRFERRHPLEWNIVPYSICAGKLREKDLEFDTSSKNRLVPWEFDTGNPMTWQTD